MKKDEIQIVRGDDAVSFMEGSEYCKKYIATGKITFGISKIPVATRGTKDPGHVNSQEVFYVIRGNVLIYVEESGNYYELKEGDVALINEGVSHTLVNVGDIPAVLSWSMSPSEI